MPADGPVLVGDRRAADAGAARWVASGPGAPRPVRADSSTCTSAAVHDHSVGREVLRSSRPARGRRVRDRARAPPHLAISNDPRGDRQTAAERLRVDASVRRCSTASIATSGTMDANRMPASRPRPAQRRAHPPRPGTRSSGRTPSRGPAHASPRTARRRRRSRHRSSAVTRPPASSGLAPERRRRRVAHPGSRASLGPRRVCRHERTREHHSRRRPRGPPIGMPVERGRRA